jgi:hypothetical protein
MNLLSNYLQAEKQVEKLCDAMDKLWLDLTDMEHQWLNSDRTKALITKVGTIGPEGRSLFGWDMTGEHCKEKPAGMAFQNYGTALVGGYTIDELRAISKLGDR